MAKDDGHGIMNGPRLPAYLLHAICIGDTNKPVSDKLGKHGLMKNLTKVSIIMVYNNWIATYGNDTNSWKVNYPAQYYKKVES